MNKIVLIGASGFIGSAILKEAIDRGHQVKAVSRHPEKISLANKSLTKVAGDVSDPEFVARVCKGADIVIIVWYYRVIVDLIG